jgi:hypothetical protein
MYASERSGQTLSRGVGPNTRLPGLALLALIAASCFWSDDPQDDVLPRSPSGAAELEIRAEDVGGYELYLQCIGQGSPTVILETPTGPARAPGSRRTCGSTWARPKLSLATRQAWGIAP